jgi:hypothetical protein
LLKFYDILLYMNDKILNLLLEYDSSNINKKKEIINLLLKEIKVSSNKISNLQNKLLEEEQKIFKEIIINE